jgi:hypothetical protein
MKNFYRIWLGKALFPDGAPGFNHKRGGKKRDDIIIPFCLKEKQNHSHGSGNNQTQDEKGNKSKKGNLSA